MKPPIVSQFDQTMDGYIDNDAPNKFTLGSPFQYKSTTRGIVSRAKTSSTVDEVAPLRINATKAQKKPAHEDSISTPLSTPRSTPRSSASTDTPLIDATIEATTRSDFELKQETEATSNISNTNHRSLTHHQRTHTPTSIKAHSRNRSDSSQASPREPHTPRSWESNEPRDLRGTRVLSLNSPPSLSYSLRSSDLHSGQMIERMRRKHNCIREMYNTEWQFAQDMAVVVRIYICASASVGFSIREIDTLFLNISEVMDISLCTVAILENNIPPQILHGEGGLTAQDVLADRDIKIGKAMCIALTGQLYEIYEYYIHRNQEQMQLYQDLMRLMKESLGPSYNLDQYGSPKSPKSAKSSVSAISTIDPTTVNNKLRLSLDTNVSGRTSCSNTKKGNNNANTNATNSNTKRNHHSAGKHDHPQEIPRKKHSVADMRKMKEWLDSCRERASKFTTAWALDCLLIKPIQRLGKYPLFLKTILDCSSPEEEGYEELLRAYQRSKRYLDCVNTRYGQTN